MPLIYKLYDELDCYVGSTTLTLKRRLAIHNRCRDCYSRIIINRNKFTMELIEEVETNDRFKREQYWIDELSTLPQIKCYFESEEVRIIYMTNYYKVYRENNKESLKQYYETNKEVLALKHKQYNEINKEKIALNRKRYYETNLESILEKCKVYRENNKDIIKEKKEEKFSCECGGKYINSHKSRHLKTKKHLAYIDAERQKSNQS